MQPFPDVTHTTQTIENRRALLRKALLRNPHDHFALQSLLNSMQPAYVQHAARRGVFVCYSRTDELFALELKTRLQAVGVRAWMDEIDMPLEGDWEQTVGSALRGCGVLLLVLSPEAIQDDEVQEERRYFIEQGKVVLPVLAKRCDASDQDLLLHPLDMQADFEGKLRILLHYLEKPAQAPASVR